MLLLKGSQFPVTPTSRTAEYSLTHNSRVQGLFFRQQELLLFSDRILYQLLEKRSHGNYKILCIVRQPTLS